MTQEFVAILLDEKRLTLDELAATCTVSREWVIEHVRAGVIAADPDSEPDQWLFSSRELRRTRRLHDLERSFDANPELAGLVADLVEELDRLRMRLRRAGLTTD